MKHTIKLLTLAFMLATILTLTGCPGPVNTETPCTHENKKTVIETAATCTETGLEKIICADCGELIEEKEIAIDPDNHSFGDWKTTKNPTCTEKGSKTRKCSRCGETETVEIDALGHDWEEIITDKTKAATCTEDGLAVYKCKTCGAIEERTVSKLGHNFGEWSDWTTTKVLAYNQDKEEEHTRTCKRCGHSETEKVVTSRFVAGGYDGELPDGVNNIKHFQYEDGYKIELNVCTSAEYPEPNWKKLYFSFPENIEPNYSIKDLLGLKEYYKNKNVSFVISNDGTRYLEANVKITKDMYSGNSLYCGCYVVIE